MGSQSNKDACIFLYQKMLYHYGRLIYENFTSGSTQPSATQFPDKLNAMDLDHIFTFDDDEFGRV